MFDTGSPTSHQTINQPPSKYERAWCVLPFIAACGYILFWALSRDTGWVLIEAFAWKNVIARDVMSGSWGNLLKRGFDIATFEFAPRSTRPFSSLFEVADTFLRIRLWDFISPHPSLSLTWLLTLLAAPWFLYRVLLLRGVPAFATLPLIGVYLTQMGTLSYVVMLFRPGKPVTLFFLIVCWYLCEQLMLEGFKWSRYALLLCSLLLSSLFDEYTLLTYMLAALMISGLLRRKPLLIIQFLIPGALYLLTAFKIFPWLAHQFYGQHILLTNYGANYGLGLKSADFLSYDFIYLLLWNIWVLIRESFCLYNPFDVLNPWYRGVVLLHLAVTALLSGLLLRRLMVRLYSDGLKRTFVSGPSMALILLCAFIAMAFHGATMFIVDNKIWGPYYYGAFMGVIATLFAAELWKLGGMVRMVTYVWIATLILTSMVTFPALNNVYKQLHYYPTNPIEIRKVFIGRANRFEFSDRRLLSSDAIRQLSSIDWKRQEKPVGVPKHLLWLVLERAGMEFSYEEYNSCANVAIYSVSSRGIEKGTYIK